MRDDARKLLAEQLTLDGMPMDCREIANAVGMEGLIALCEAVGGTQIYLPKADTLLASVLPRVIREEYNGYNVQALARKYGVSERTVYNYIQGCSPSPIDGQITMDSFLNNE